MMKAPRPADGQAHVRDLDAFRGIAILGVVTFHTCSTFGLVGIYLPKAFVTLFSTGSLGVFLFFVLSGFLLTSTESLRQKQGTYSLRAYACRRFLRLAPAYYLSLLLYLGCNGRFGIPLYQSFINPGIEMFFNLTMLHTLLPSVWAINPSYWSLTPEVVFYLVLPIIVSCSVSRLLRFYMISLAAAISLQLLSAHSPTLRQHDYLATSPAAQMHVFLAGSLLSLFASRSTGSVSHRSAQGWANALLLVGIGGIASVQFLPTPIIAPVLPSPISGLVLVMLTIVIFAAWVIGSSWLRQMLAIPGLAAIGRVSYSIFLFHYLFIQLSYAVGFLQALRVRAGAGAPCLLAYLFYLAVIFGATFLFSTLTYKYIEVPCMHAFRRRTALPKPTVGA